MAVVGIIANPTSGKDIRRLVGQALVVSNQEKVNIVKRCLIGLRSSGVDSVLIMPDRFGIGMRAIDDLKPIFSDAGKMVTILDMAVSDSAQDSILAAEMMRDLRVDVIITLGGDGTVRVAAKGSGSIAMLPLSTGTNNVLPTFTEGTIAGMAAGKFAQLPVEKRSGLINRQKKIEIYLNQELLDIALVDVVILSGAHVGSRAIWETDNLLQIAVTRAAVNLMGFSNILAQFSEVSPFESFGLMADIVDRDTENNGPITAAIGPGMTKNVFLSGVKKMLPGEKYPIHGKGPYVVALDGEREFVVNEKDDVFLILSTEGPYFLNVQKTMTCRWK